MAAANTQEVLQAVCQIWKKGKIQRLKPSEQGGKIRRKV